MLLKAKLKENIWDQRQRAQAPQSRQAQSTVLTARVHSSRSVALSPRIKGMATTREKKKATPLTFWKSVQRQRNNNTTQTDTWTEHKSTVGTQFDGPRTRKSSFATQTVGSPQRRSRQTAKAEAETSVDRSGASMVLMIPQDLDLSTFILPKQVIMNLELPWQRQGGGNSCLRIPVELLWQFQSHTRTG